MESKSCRFLLGLGLGSLLGAFVYRCSKTGKCKEWKEKVCCAMKSAANQAGEWVANTKENVADAAMKTADNVADKAEQMKDKVHSYADNNRK